MTAASSPTFRRALERSPGTSSSQPSTSMASTWPIDVPRRGLADALARSAPADIAEFLGRLSRDRLKALCRDLALDDSGGETAVLIERLLPRQAKADGHAGQLILQLSSASLSSASPAYSSAPTMQTSTPTPPPP